MTSVLVLGGGPDPERGVSIDSAQAVARAFRDEGSFEVVERTIDRPDLDELRSMPGDVVFPVLHGPFGEGGPLQDLLEADARPYVGSGARAARLAIDKMASKLAAARCTVPTPHAQVLNTSDDRPGLDPPFVVKPVHEGSSVGVHMVRADDDWASALGAVRADVAEHPSRVYMIEQMIEGRELTVGLFDTGDGLEALDVTEIRPAEGYYDFDAKYERDDTAYIVGPDLPDGVGLAARQHAVAVASALGVRDLARADFLLDSHDRLFFLEINTMPGFTGHSLLPMAAERRGYPMPAFCAHLVRRALDRGGRRGR